MVISFSDSSGDLVVMGVISMTFVPYCSSLVRHVRRLQSTHQQSPFLLRHFLRRILNRVNDVRVTGAPAQVAFQRVSDLFTGRFGIALEQLRAGQDHTGSAIATLQAVAVPKTLLHRVQLAVFGQTLNGGDLGAVRLHCQQRAGFDRLAIEQDCAGAANARFTADMSAGQLAVVTEEMDEERARLDRVFVFDSIDADVDDRFHVLIGNRPVSR